MKPLRVSLSLVVPFHRDVERLELTLQKLDELRGSASPFAEVLFCHNGPHWPLPDASALEQRLPPGCRLLHTPDKGLGAGYRLGLREARSDYVVLSASDLPFGLSDVEAFGRVAELRGGAPEFAIGSKGHPGSSLGEHPRLRRLSSFVFRFFRRMFWGPRAPTDTQGSLIVRRGLAQQLAEHCPSNDYAFSLELIAEALARKVEVLELPIRLEARGDASSVSIVGDGVKLLRKTWELRRKVR